jgi:hypothetical protein
MSHPRESATQSSSPLKSSLSRARGPTRSLLPSPHFDLLSRSSTNEEAIEASVEEPVRDFQPFFILIESLATSEHHHPTVHYIFADDDAEILTEAACRALAQDDPQHVSQQEDKLPAPVDGVREHYIILDVRPNEAAYIVAKAHSLSSEWQVTKASVSNAPTFDGTDAEFEGLMLKVEGIGASPQIEPEDSSLRKESLQQMMDRFEKGLLEIRKIVDKDET